MSTEQPESPTSDQGLAYHNRPQHTHSDEMDCHDRCPTYAWDAEWDRQTREGDLMGSKGNIEGWEALPADSEAAVDYPRGEVSETGQLTSVNNFSSFYVPKPELRVEMVVYLPDGRQYRYEEAVEYEGDITEAFEDVYPQINAVSTTMLRRFGQ